MRHPGFWASRRSGVMMAANLLKGANSGSTTTRFFFKGAAPFLPCRRSCISLPAAGSSVVAAAGGSRYCRRPPILYSNKTKDLEISRRIGRRNLSCYCAQDLDVGVSSPATAASDGNGDNSIREAANSLDIRVGKILKAWRHEEADSLYVEEVDVGETEPRIICSGLVKYIPIHLLQDRSVIVLANLKPRNMRGVKSNGMLMAASDAAHENVELLSPPDGAVPGERVWFGSDDEKENLPDVASPNQVQKKKVWELVQPHLKTDELGAAKLGMHEMRTSAGVVVSGSLKNANIS